MTAGHDTTSSSTSGAIWGLSESPGELRKLKERPELTGNLLDEAIRWTNPVSHFMRSATGTEVGGRPIRKGDWLMLSYLSANNDETVFDDPEHFRVDRDASRHIAFGTGAHACLGQHLARLEMRILFEELLPRLHSLELAGEPKRSHALPSSGGPRHSRCNSCSGSKCYELPGRIDLEGGSAFGLTTGRKRTSLGTRKIRKVPSNRAVLTFLPATCSLPRTTDIIRPAWRPVHYLLLQ